MNSPRLDLVGYFIHENRGLLSLFALGPKILREGPAHVRSHLSSAINRALSRK
jgi:hypothetical protein